MYLHVTVMIGVAMVMHKRSFGVSSLRAKVVLAPVFFLVRFHKVAAKKFQRVLVHLTYVKVKKHVHQSWNAGPNSTLLIRNYIS